MKRCEGSRENHNTIRECVLLYLDEYQIFKPLQVNDHQASDGKKNLPNVAGERTYHQLDMFSSHLLMPASVSSH